MTNRMYGRSAIFLLFAVCFLVSQVVTASEYIIDVPGTQSTLKGNTVIVGSETYPVIQTLVIKDPQVQADSSQVWIIHENRTSVGDQQEKLLLRAYIIKPDGIYCVAQSEKTSKPLEKLNQPYKIIPIPAEKDASWDVKYTEDGKKVNLKYRVVDPNETVTVGEKTFQTLHLKAEGNVEVFGMQIPVVKDVWWEKTLGTIKSNSIQRIQDKETRTELIIQL